MPIDPAKAIGADLGTTGCAWTSSDVLLYHLALGAGADPTSDAELRYVLEDRLRVLPTFGVVAPNFRTFDPPAVSFPGIEIDLAKVLHGTQSITIHRPIDTSGEAIAKARVAEVWDKGKAAVIVQESTVYSPTSEPLWTTRTGIFAKDEGNFGGERGPTEHRPAPTRDPDLVVEVPTLPQQALLYRLCGDRNPLHADPAFARTAGFDRPILHGLCTYGMVCKAVVDNMLDGDVSQVAAYEARFAGAVHPGDSLRIHMWQTDEGIQSVTTSAGTVVLDETLLTVR